VIEAKRRLEEKPELIDGRDDRARQIDAEVEAWARRCKIVLPAETCPSVKMRKRGIRCAKDYAIIQCPWRFSASARQCNYFIIVRRGQQTVQCPRCNHRLWLAKLHVLATSDDQSELRRLISHFCGNAGAGRFLLYQAPLKKVLRRAHSSRVRENPGRLASAKSPVEPQPLSERNAM